MKTDTKAPGTGKKVEEKKLFDSFRHVNALVVDLRAFSKEKLNHILEICESFDFNKVGKLKLPTFCNILLFNLDNISEEQLVNF